MWDGCMSTDDKFLCTVKQVVFLYHLNLSHNIQTTNSPISDTCTQVYKVCLWMGCCFVWLDTRYIGSCIMLYCSYRGPNLGVFTAVIGDQT